MDLLKLEIAKINLISWTLTDIKSAHRFISELFYLIILRYSRER